MHRILLILLLIGLVSPAMSQSRIDSLRSTLEEYAKDYPGMEETVELSVSGVTLREFMRSLASNHNLNLSVDGTIEGQVANNFANAQVLDVIVFLCREYDLEIEVFGSILSVKQRIQPEPEEVMRSLVEYNDLNGFMSLDLRRDSIQRVVKEMTQETGINVLFAPEIGQARLSVFVKNRPFENALDMMAEANGLRIEKKSERYFLIVPDKAPEPEPQVAQEKALPTADDLLNIPVEGLEVVVNERGLLDIKARNVELKDLLSVVSYQTDNRYFLYSEPQGKVSLYISNATYQEFLVYLLGGTDMTYTVDESIYLIGNRNREILRTTELVRLENRTVETVIDFIPEELRKGVDIKEFIELNGLVLSGSRPNIREIKTFLASIDQVVPVVKIEVMIVDVSRNATVSMGIDMQLGGDNVPTNTTGTFSPGVNVTMNSSTINELINSFNGFGLVNLGQVTPDFYASIQALENNGVLKMRSTPMLATLNGHEANLKIGNTEYYLEVRNDLIGTQNPVQQSSQIYRAVNADLSVTIKPIVSSGENVTLEIEVEQSDFTARIAETAPPGTVTRNFKSMIRVENGEMILLGGLEEKSVSNTGSGLPFLSRIPVIKWFFGQRTRTDQNSRLNIFIRPTVVY